MDPLARIQELTQRLHYLNNQYYQHDISEVSDQEFDQLLAELAQLEKDHPALASPNSPTQRVGGAVTKQFATAAHRYPMLSLGNTYSEDDLREFDERVQRGLEGAPYAYVCEQKFDGVAMSLSYQATSVQIDILKYSMNWIGSTNHFYKFTIIKICFLKCFFRLIFVFSLSIKTTDLF